VERIKTTTTTMIRTTATVPAVVAVAAAAVVATREVEMLGLSFQAFLIVPLREERKERVVGKVVDEERKDERSEHKS
jgi:hypothetical protein